MEDWIRVSAKTVADAVTEATIQLCTSSDNIEYRVIEKGTAGFFGIGAKKAVIEAKKKKTDEDLMKEVFGDKEEKPKKESRKEPKKEIKEAKSFVEEKNQPEVKKELKKEQKEFRKENKKEQKEFKKEQKEIRKETKPVKESEESAKGKETVAENAPKEEVRESFRNGRKENCREGRKNGQRNTRKSGYRDNWKENEKISEEKISAEEPVSDETMIETREEHAPKTPRVPADPEEAKRRAEKFLTDLFQTMDMSVQMEITFEDDVLSVNIDGEDMGILIGKRGQTLDSLQYLTSLVVNKGNASYVRVKLDTEDYRSRRKATLENLAKNIAMKVKKTRRPVFLEPMNPYERRIIHSALQNDPYVTTHSEGEEPCRKVVVTLRKNNDRYERKSQRSERRPRQEAALQTEVKEEQVSEE